MPDIARTTLNVLIILSDDGEGLRVVIERMLEKLNRRKETAQPFFLRAVYLDANAVDSSAPFQAERRRREQMAKCDLLVGVLSAPLAGRKQPWRPGADAELREACINLQTLEPTRSLVYCENAAIPFGAGLDEMQPYIALIKFREELGRMAKVSMFSGTAELEAHVEEDLQSVLAQGEGIVTARAFGVQEQTGSPAVAPSEEANTVDLPPPDAKPEQNPATRSMSPTGRERVVWKECDGRQTIEEIARVSELDLGMVRQIVQKLAKEKLVHLPDHSHRWKNWRY